MCNIITDRTDYEGIAASMLHNRTCYAIGTTRYKNVGEFLKAIFWGEKSGPIFLRNDSCGITDESACAPFVHRATGKLLWHNGHSYEYDYDFDRTDSQVIADECDYDELLRLSEEDGQRFLLGNEKIGPWFDEHHSATYHLDGQFVAVYGTLKRQEGNNGIMGDSIFVCNAKSAHKFPMVGLGMPFPYLYDEPDTGHYIDVEIWMVSNDRIIDHLDALEGVDYDHYYRRRTEFVTEFGPTIEAWAYFARHERNYDDPIIQSWPAEGHTAS